MSPLARTSKASSVKLIHGSLKRPVSKAKTHSGILVHAIEIFILSARISDKNQEKASGGRPALERAPGLGTQHPTAGPLAVIGFSVVIEALVSKTLSGLTQAPDITTTDC